ncbi:MAG: metallophosphoesterase [Thermoanaerobaculia bacterium]
MRRLAVLLLPLVAACASIQPPTSEQCAGLALDIPRVERPAERPSIRIAILGDSGDEQSEGWPAVVELVAQAAPDAILLLGDNFYECGIADVDTPRWAHYRTLLDLGVPVFPVLGNHDYGCGSEPADPDAQIAATSRLDNWVFPARSYSVRFGDLLEIAMLDTQPLAKSWSDSATTGCALRAMTASTAPRWRIAAGHHTIVAGGAHTFITPGEVRAMRSLTPILRENGFALYAAGHDHHLELIPGDPAWLISGSASRVRPAAPIYGSVYRAARLGIAILEADRESVTVRFATVDGEPSKRFEIED